MMVVTTLEATMNMMQLKYVPAGYILKLWLGSDWAEKCKTNAWSLSFRLLLLLHCNQAKCIFSCPDSSIPDLGQWVSDRHFRILTHSDFWNLRPFRYSEWSLDKKTKRQKVKMTKNIKRQHNKKQHAKKTKWLKAEKTKRRRKKDQKENFILWHRAVSHSCDVFIYF